MLALLFYAAAATAPPPPASQDCAGFEVWSGGDMGLTNKLRDALVIEAGGSCISDRCKYVIEISDNVVPVQNDTKFSYSIAIYRDRSFKTKISTFGGECAVNDFKRCAREIMIRSYQAVQNQ